MGSTTAGMGGGGCSLGDMVAGAGVESGVRPCTSAGSRSKLMKLVIFSCLMYYLILLPMKWCWGIVRNQVSHILYGQNRHNRFKSKKLPRIAI